MTTSSSRIKRVGLTFSGQFKSCMDTLQLWTDKHHQRKKLAQLDLNELQDMGIDPADAYQEINKPFWK